jgi:hypothetical protein
VGNTVDPVQRQRGATAGPLVGWQNGSIDQPDNREENGTVSSGPNPYDYTGRQRERLEREHHKEIAARRNPTAPRQLRQDQEDEPDSGYVYDGVTGDRIGRVEE